MTTSHAMNRPPASDLAPVWTLRIAGLVTLPFFAVDEYELTDRAGAVGGKATASLNAEERASVTTVEPSSSRLSQPVLWALAEQ